MFYRLYKPYNRFWDVVSSILLVILLAVCLFVIFVTVMAPKGADGASQIFGYELRIVSTDSMAKNESTDVSEYEIGSLPKNTMIALSLVPDREAEERDFYAGIEVGDVLTVRYAYDRQVTITHRVTKITEKDDGTGYIIELEGDNKDSDATQLHQTIDTSETESHNYVIGKVVWKSHFAGVVVGGIQRFFKSFAN